MRAPSRTGRRAITLDVVSVLDKRLVQYLTSYEEVSILKLNHVNLTVTDVEAAAAFLERYFGLRKQHGNKGFVLLFDDDGMVLTLMKAGQVAYPKTFHIGFAQDSEAQVNAIYQRLKDDGYEVNPPERSHGWTFYIQAPGGFLVEVLS